MCKEWASSNVILSTIFNADKVFSGEGGVISALVSLRDLLYVQFDLHRSVDLYDEQCRTSTARVDDKFSRLSCRGNNEKRVDEIYD